MKETKEKVEDVTINFKEKNLRNEVSKEDLKRENNKISVMKLSQEEHKKQINRKYNAMRKIEHDRKKILDIKEIWKKHF